MITDHYYDVKVADAQGNPIPSPEPIATLQRALLVAEMAGAHTGTIFYVEDPALPAQPVIEWVDGTPREVSDEDRTTSNA